MPLARTSPSPNSPARAQAATPPNRRAQRSSPRRFCCGLRLPAGEFALRDARLRAASAQRGSHRTCHSRPCASLVVPRPRPANRPIFGERFSRPVMATTEYHPRPPHTRRSFTRRARVTQESRDATHTTTYLTRKLRNANVGYGEVTVERKALLLGPDSVPRQESCRRCRPDWQRGKTR